jgi:NADPH2:quinone reductase
MKAVRIHQFGTPEVLIYEDAPIPTPAPGAFLIRVHAAGVNPVDYKTRKGGGVANRFGILPFPLILGWDVAGEVVENGGNNQFPNGARVYGMIGFPDRGEAYAEYAVADAHALALMPRNLDFAAAAGVPLAALTAWQALFDAGDLQPGQRVLIHAAAGGVGHLAVQLAKWRGAYVVGTASPTNHDYLRGIGADEVIDYNTQPFESAGLFDLVLDGMGGDTQARSYSVVRPGGRLIIIVQRPDEARAAAHKITVQHVLVAQNGAQLAQITELIEGGQVTPLVHATFPLEQAADAHRLLETGHVRGKVVLTMDG